MQKKVDALYHQTCDDVYGMVGLHFQRHQKLEKVAGFQVENTEQREELSKIGPQVKM